MMRKDVKLGFAIGGVLLSVLVVYVLVVSGESPANDPVALSTGDGQTSTQITAEEKAPEAAPTVVAEAPANKPAEVAAKPTAPAAEEEKPAAVGTDPFGSVASNDPPAADEKMTRDPWAAALHQGTTPPLLMTTTPGAATPSSPVVLASNSGNVSGSGRVEAVGSSPAVTPISANRPGRVSPELAPTTRPNPAASDPTTYIVQNGETFVSIAQAKYGNSAYYSHLIRANPNIDPRKLRPGMAIKVPPASEVKAVVNTPTQEAAAPVDEKSEYRIASGDSLYKISIKLYGKADRADKIYELNKAAIGTDPAKLKLGMVLKLPEAPTVK
jgi:nucleoid-associated protein YgaU